jgi:hypothetical protein
MANIWARSRPPLPRREASDSEGGPFLCFIELRAKTVTNELTPSMTRLP